MEEEPKLLFLKLMAIGGVKNGKSALFHLTCPYPGLKLALESLNPALLPGFLQEIFLVNRDDPDVFTH